MSFGNKLRQLRLESNMTQEDLSKKLNVSRATVGRYETDERFPDKNILKDIADIFNVSIDYLLGRTNVKNPDIFSKESLYEDSDNISNYRLIENEIRKKLISKNIITENDSVPRDIVENTVHHGIEAAIKIYLLEKQLKKKE